ncbi:MAG TPA: hypothetical protein VGF79_10700 [Bacteroidia bacterium]
MIKLRLVISSISILAVQGLYAQVITPTPPPVELPTVDSIAAPATDYNYEDMDAVAVEAYDEEYNENYNKKPFGSKSFDKIELNPDKPAVYFAGTSALLTEIQGNLVVPYYYGQGAKYVFIELTVGKDSMLYNANILFSPGNQDYTHNAFTVLQNLDFNFIPAMKNGKPVDSKIIIPIRFEALNKY